MLTEKRIAEFKEFQRIADHFETIAEGLKGKARATATAAFLQGVVAATNRDPIDPVLWIATLRNDIGELKGLEAKHST